ncbi:pyruvate carboxyltransferase [Marinomonas mediterranea]|uniref:2-isopropylmalate synthase n=1 Tax=Marinomonas mediterranea (strain ATCC 700492 / JCM 21426 / NBRC 103028 / MMB-1) TaxID=717774 RepID=F2JX54_MARM1|nr:pyruvate carboxyltransferase [Marinomonas mediterranea]ADZ89573.1 pyruvate carboxyltransferase [Marinomonas mediterranea MMB-1]WCN07667.1 pyruvate carboxyltransferase [Marinomonas mediterranea]WCN15816.1 pyruvate carboxyltransferase [Marinomonas mediterranea MMB-1]
MNANLYYKNLRFNNFPVPFLVDETLREGVERCPFPISVESKMQLLEKMTEAGIRDFIVGCGPEKPDVWEALFKYREANRIPKDTEASYIILLNCWETAFDYFKKGNFNPDWIKETTFSFGMINYRESQGTFKKAVDAFRSLGAGKFKASVLNNFRNGVEPEKYAEICRQINNALELGVSIIRINDSVGSMQPHITHQLCSTLVKDYPKTIFCFHAHNDTGLALANAMASIQAGFQMIEGSLAGFGNRSGIAPMEQVLNMCRVNNIKVGRQPIDMKKLLEAALLSEDIFMQAPNVFRPVSGAMETDSNFGVLNIPDFLGVPDKKNYFVNYPGLHPDTIKMAFKKCEIKNIYTEEEILEGIDKLRSIMETEIHSITESYQDMKSSVYRFYHENSWGYEKLSKNFIDIMK